VAPNAVDTRLFGALPSRDRARAELGVSGVCLLCVGRLDREKGVDLAIRALALLPPEVTLTVIGAGPEREELERLAGREAYGRVRFAGFLPQARVAEWYAAADAVVLPSRSEQWGMVLNEAAAASLPIVASDAAGAAHELVEPGGNGFRFPSDDLPALEAALRRLVEDSGFRRLAALRSKELSRRFEPEAWAESVARLASDLVRLASADGVAGLDPANGAEWRRRR
jgi:glycosyltransferase involved in cell wall biosynthesis